MPKSAGRNLYRRNGVFWARVQVSGHDIRKSLRTSDRAEANKRLNALLKDADRIRFGEEGRHKYEDAVIAWAEARFGGVKESSAHRYRVSLRMLHGHFSPLYLDQINGREIGKYVRERTRTGATNATIRRDLSALSRLTAHACAMGWSEDNAARAWDRSVIKQRKFVIERVDPGAYAAVRAAANPMFARFMDALLETGCRCDELASAKRRGFDAAAGSLEVMGKTGRRTITLSPTAIALIAKLPQHLKSEYLFWQPAGERYMRPSQRFHEFRQAAQKLARKEKRAFKTFRLHDLRHEYAIRFLKTGGEQGGAGSIYVLQQHLGHSSVKTTEIYLEFLTADQALTAKGLSAQKAAQGARINTGKPLSNMGENDDD